jgi:hypothetical protein
MLGHLGALWGLTGVALLLVSAMYRLSPHAVEAMAMSFVWYHYLALTAVIFFMAYFEGYRAFQLGFSPRVAARARYLKDNSRLLHVLLAPAFCMGFFYTTRRRQITSISVTTGIVALVVLIRYLSQPWRGIIDAGVLVGLGWGLISLILFGIQALTSSRFSHSPEVPPPVS